MTKTVFKFLALNQNFNILSDSMQIKFAKNYLSGLKNNIENNNIARIKFPSMQNLSNGSSINIFYQKVRNIKNNFSK